MNNWKGVAVQWSWQQTSTLSPWWAPEILREPTAAGHAASQVHNCFKAGSTCADYGLAAMLQP
jgi:hypothetical protein